MAPTIIGLHGYAQSGKDTVAKMLEPYGYQRLAFADRLRECVYALNPWVDFHDSHVRLQRIVDLHGWEYAKVHCGEIRRLLQVFGTEVGRELIADSIWVDIVLDQMRDGLDHEEAKFVITDMRFPNEIDGLSIFGDEEGVSVSFWKVERPGVGPVNAHVSDAGLDDKMFDVIVENDGTLDDLEAMVLVALNGADLQASVDNALSR